MADSKPWLKRSRMLKMLLLVLGFLWMGNVFFQENAGGQTLPGQPGSAPVLPPATTAPQPLPAGSQTTFLALTAPAPIRFQFSIPADALLKDLLPIPPKERGRTGPAFIEDLAQVPEVAFQEPLAKTPEALKLTAHTMAKINHLNRKQNDGFMKALLEGRADLAGLPMAMGDACRTKGDRTQYFSQALAAIKRAKGQGNMAVNFTSTPAGPVLPPAVAPVVSPPPPAGQSGPSKPPTGLQPAPTEPVEVKINQEARPVDFVTLTNATMAFMAIGHVDPNTFWERFEKICAEEDKANNNLDPGQLEQVTLARIAALMQVMAPESIAMRKGLVKYLSRTSHPDATRALARLAIFTADDDVRSPALDALKVRREKDYTEVLLRGLHYPLPAVARRATEAMIKLERADMVADLVNFLEEPDPRAPALKEIGNKKVPVVRELVRINHHRNC
ncbi:MAG TPA: HEAT repeat domain-containing protein, partial [Gemmataceae bacterium]|nr:HEAT repeat domain-containing protein [Gemmataceae bacterium]